MVACAAACAVACAFACAVACAVASAVAHVVCHVDVLRSFATVHSLLDSSAVLRLRYASADQSEDARLGNSKDDACDSRFAQLVEELVCMFEDVVEQKDSMDSRLAQTFVRKDFLVCVGTVLENQVETVLWNSSLYSHSMYPKC